MFASHLCLLGKLFVCLNLDKQISFRINFLFKILFLRLHLKKTSILLSPCVRQTQLCISCNEPYIVITQPQSPFIEKIPKWADLTNHFKP